MVFCDAIELKPSFAMFVSQLFKSLFYLLFVSVWMMNTAGAQSDQRRDFIEGLFKSIIESRSDRNRQIPGNQPVAPKLPVPAHVPSAPAISKEVAAYRNQIGAYAKEIDKLAIGMAQASQQTPTLRVYLPELYAVRTQAAILQQRSVAVNNLNGAAPDFRALDIGWRNLAYRMKSDQSLNGQCRTCVKNIDNYGGKLCGLFGIQADFDRIQATMYAAQASAYIDTLLDVLQHELYDQPNCNELVAQGRQQMELARQFASNVHAYQLGEAVGAFEQWSISWRQYGAQLHAFHKPGLARAVGRVRRTQNDMYDLMRIERPIDYGYIDYLSAQCRFAADDMFGNLSIQTLSGLNRNQLDAVFQAKKSISGQFGNFCKVVGGNPNHNQVVRDFITLENNWKRCDSHLAGLPGDVSSYRVTISGHIGEIRNLLQVAERLDMSRALSQAASIHGMAQGLFNNLVAAAGYIPSRNARSQSLVLAQQFLKNSQAFHVQVASGADFPTLQKSCGILVDSWRACSQVIQGLPAAGLAPQIYGQIELTRSQIDPSLAELAVVLAP